MGTETHAGLNVKSPLLLFNFKQKWNVSTNFSNTPVKFNESPFSGPRVVTGGNTDGHTFVISLQTDLKRMNKLRRKQHSMSNIIVI